MAGIGLRSPAFSDHDFIARHHAHDDANLSPALEWSDVPEDAAELLLLCEDPDAPSGTFTHWMVAGIDRSVSGVDEGEVPEGGVPEGGVQGRNDFGEIGYGGPLPPIGDPPHRYFFRVIAVARRTGLPEGFSRQDFDRAVAQCGELESGNLVGQYAR